MEFTRAKRLTFLIALTLFQTVSHGLDFACQGYEEKAAEYRKAFSEYSQQVTSNTSQWGSDLFDLHQVVQAWEGQLVRVPAGMFDVVVATSEQMDISATEWSDLSLGLDDISYSLEDLVANCETLPESWVERFQEIASEQRLLENQLISYLQGSVDFLRSPVSSWLSWHGVEVVVPKESFLPLQTIGQNHKRVSEEYLPDLFEAHIIAFDSLITELEQYYGQGRAN